uniref:Uncharacterized protein n=1 Tax=Chromera velia CCMP2878 TaxID=1169474 RepID=A0A0G4HB63_9ALVE|eukprot:Cvel_6162.t1-p1 / transcript=Cvel_6162.t1 / gene=Cvel_6162 / organism=Chromera_velia_CCMP2878 / gene_product=hypothetical protein / transcript_product=hypothetical protein / location=Cvel_scaffold298:65057-67175(-) / protein_length=422 / sequence_SO=supercontig / SO=protein_coding / is_pseudo=false
MPLLQPDPADHADVDELLRHEFLSEVVNCTVMQIPSLFPSDSDALSQLNVGQAEGGGQGAEGGVAVEVGSVGVLGGVGETDAVSQRQVAAKQEERSVGESSHGDKEDEDEESEEQEEVLEGEGKEEEGEESDKEGEGVDIDEIFAAFDHPDDESEEGGGREAVPVSAVGEEGDSALSAAGGLEDKMKVKEKEGDIMPVEVEKKSKKKGGQEEGSEEEGEGGAWQYRDASAGREQAEIRFSTHDSSSVPALFTEERPGIGDSWHQQGGDSNDHINSLSGCFFERGGKDSAEQQRDDNRSPGPSSSAARAFPLSSQIPADDASQGVIESLLSREEEGSAHMFQDLQPSASALPNRSAGERESGAGGEEGREALQLPKGVFHHVERGRFYTCFSVDNHKYEISFSYKKDFRKAVSDTPSTRETGW